MENTISGLKESARDYVNSRLDVIKLKAINTGSSVVAGVAVGVALAVLGFLTLIFLGFSAAYAISFATDKPWLGFFVVGMFYAIVCVAIVMLKDKVITLPLINMLMRKIYYKEADAPDDDAAANPAA